MSDNEISDNEMAANEMPSFEKDCLGGREIPDAAFCGKPLER